MTATSERCPRCDADRDVCDRFRIFPWATPADARDMEPWASIRRAVEECEANAAPFVLMREHAALWWRAFAASWAGVAAVLVFDERKAWRSAQACLAQVSADAVRAAEAERDRMRAALTVGAALALPEVQRGEAVIESREGGRVQVVIRSAGVRVRCLLGGQWTSWGILDGYDAELLTMPCKVVALAEADAPPATREEAGRG